MTTYIDNTKDVRLGLQLTMAGAGTVVIGSLLPWATLTSIFGTMSINGIEGDGKFTFLAGVILLGLAFLQFTGKLNRSRHVLIAAWVTLIVVGLIAIAVFARIGSAGDSEYALASVGVGLYITIGGVLLALYGADKTRRSS